jgi:ABC-2 type transport system ATP-binding protein
MTSSKIIIVDNLSLAYGPTVAVRELNLTVDDGEVLALLGGKSSGKTTILRVVAGELIPDSGFIYVCGIDAVTQAGLVRTRLGLIRHEHRLDPQMSARANLEEQAALRFFAPEEAEQRADELLTLAAMTPRAGDLMSTYTAEEWSRIELAAGLIHRPQVLLADEPSRGCDFAARERIWDAFRNLRPQVRAVLITTSDDAEARALADRVARI